MKKSSVYDYYSFGNNYSETRNNWDSKLVSDAVEELTEYLEELDDLELPVTSAIAKPLHTILKALETQQPDQKIPKALGNQISEIIEKADPALDAELGQKEVLYVTPKRFDVDKLLRDPQHLLASHTWGSLSECARTDYTYACKCVAFSLGTASAFHIMRTTEEMVKQLYFHYVKTKRMKKPMWGPVITKLKSKNRPKPSMELLDQLDTIRKNFRNPTQYPDKFYSIDEAQDLLFSSIVALNMIGHRRPRPRIES